MDTGKGSGMGTLKDKREYRTVKYRISNIE